MVQPFQQDLVQRHDLGHLAHGQDVHVEREAVFQIRQSEERFHQQRGVHRTALRHEHDADILGGFVPDILKQRQLAGDEELGDLLDQPRLLHLIWNFGDDDLVAAATEVLRLPLRPHAKAAAAGLVGLDDGLAAVDDDAAGRHVRAGHEFHELFDGRIGMLDQVECCVAEFMGVVGRDGRRHADRDAGGAVGKKVREGRRQDDGFLVLLVVGRAKVDGILVDPLEEESCHLGHARLGVPIGGRTVAVDIAEVALPVDDGIALREILREAHQCVIDRLVAMRVELTDDVADDAGAFLESRVGTDAHFAHCMDDATMHRLQAVPDVRKRAMHDRRQCIGEIALFECRLQVDRKNMVAALAV